MENIDYLRYKAQSVNAVQENNHCLLQASYRTHKQCAEFLMLKQAVHIVTTGCARIDMFPVPLL
jgi:hypothetical protein